MNDTRQRLKSSQKPFWKRILERHKLKGRLLRARVPLVFFRFWWPRDSRRNRPTIAQHPLSLHIQLFWQQWCGSVSKPGLPRLMIEKSIFTRSAFKELKHVMQNPRRTETSVVLRSNAPARPSAETRREPDEIARERQEGLPSTSTPSIEGVRPVLAGGGGRGLRPNLRSTHAHVLRDQGARIPTTLRLSAETIFKKQLRNVFSERNFFVSPLAGLAGLAQRGQSISAGRTSPLPFEAVTVRQIVSRHHEVTRELRRGGTSALRTNLDDVIPHLSTPGKSRFLHPAQTDGDGQESLGSARSRLFAQSAWLNFANQPADSSAERLQPQEQSSPARPPASVQPLQPQFDIGRLSEEVYRHIQRKIRVERERRGR